MKHRTLILPAMLLMVVTATTVALVLARAGKASPPEPLVIAPVTSAELDRALAPVVGPVTQGPPARERVEVEELLILETGFEPAEIRRPAGRFLLVIENRSGPQELSLQISREAGGRLLSVALPRGRLRWSDSFNAPPGHYVVTEANHPDWICRIVITAR